MNALKSFLGLALALLLSAPLAGPAQAGPPTGVYRLTPQCQPSLSLDVVGYGNADGTPVQIWNATHTSNQQWLVEDQGDGTDKIYAFSGQNSFQMLDDNNGSIANGNTVTTFGDNNATAQRWIFQDTGGGWYRIIPAAAGPNGTATLDVRGGAGAAAGATLDIYTYGGGANQLFRLDWAGVSQILPNPKKGLGGRDPETTALNCAWYYDWGEQEPADTPTAVEFVPMDWGFYPAGNPQQTAQNETNGDNWAVSQPGVKNILAYNEPDHTDQSNLTVASALDGYQYLAAVTSSVNVISPACADDQDGWLWDFMSGAAAAGYRVNGVAVHSYIRDPYAFENYITQVHNTFWQQPLWITEFAPTDWASPTAVSTQEAANFMRIVVPWLNNQWYVQRYAWYTGASPGNWTLGTAALVDYDGRLTDLGRLYSRM